MVADLSTVPDLDLGLSGFGEDELAKLLRSLDSRERRERPESFDLDAALEEARAAGGVARADLWALGDHRLLCGDAAEAGDVARLVAEAQEAFDGEDPCLPDVRHTLDHTRERLVDIHESLATYMEPFALPEPGEDEVAELRALADR